jgi:NAD(P)-dependent dehydrogenase (short-subunit alcohol dehydrogenase family)
MRRLSGLSALVTGASRGIGEAVARAFARQGATVLVTAGDPARLATVGKAIAAAGGAVRVLPADLLDPAAREHLAAAAGVVDVLVNNAGVLGPLVPLWETPLADFAAVQRVNAEAVFDLIRLIVPGMVARGRGVVINVSSSVGAAGRATWGAYAVSKFAVEGMSQVLAGDLDGTGVRCVVLNPGGTRTAMRAVAMPDEDPTTLPGPDDVAEAFVAAAAGEFANGARVDVRALLAADPRTD